MPVSSSSGGLFDQDLFKDRQEVFDILFCKGQGRVDAQDIQTRLR